MRSFNAICFCVAFIGHTHTQTSVVDFYATWGHALISPETNTIFRKHSEADIRSKQINMGVSITLWSTKRFNWKGGVAWRYLDYKYIDHVDAVIDDYGFNHVYLDKPDLIHSSSAFSVKNEFELLLNNRSQNQDWVSLGLDCYFTERFNSRYKTSDVFINYADIYNPDYYTLKPFVLFPLPETRLNRQFLTLPFIALQANYILRFKSKGILKPAITVGFGTHLYSDWHLFRKHLWLNTGLQVGIGSRKEKEN